MCVRAHARVHVCVCVCVHVGVFCTYVDAQVLDHLDVSAVDANLLKDATYIVPPVTYACVHTYICACGRVLV